MLNGAEIAARVPPFTKEQTKVNRTWSIFHPFFFLGTLAYWTEWQGWKGLYCGEGGWLAAAKAIKAIGEFLRSQGVNFGFGR